MPGVGSSHHFAPMRNLIPITLPRTWRLAQKRATARERRQMYGPAVLCKSFRQSGRCGLDLPSKRWVYAALAPSGSGQYIRSWNGAGLDCTTTFENAHRTVFREVLYRHHPWFGRRVCVHGTVDKADDVVFRCALDVAQTDRWLEVPVWMFDRTACPDAEPLTARPFVSIDALAALSALQIGRAHV